MTRLETWSARLATGASIALLLSYSLYLFDPVPTPWAHPRFNLSLYAIPLFAGLLAMGSVACGLQILVALVRRKTAPPGVVGAFTLAMIVALSLPFALLPVSLMHHTLTEERRLIGVDAAPLVEACQTIMSAPDDYSPNGTTGYMLSRADDAFGRLPGPIRELDPTNVFVETNSVTLRFMGGHHRLALRCRGQRDGARCTKELSPGLCLVSF